MADEHQTTIQAPALSPGGVTIAPRADAPPDEGGTDLAQKAQEKLASMEGFWNRVNPEKEKKEEPTEGEPKSNKPEKAEPAKAKPEKAKAKPEPKPGEEEKAEPEERPRRRKEKPEVDPIQVAEATGREIAREMARAQQAKPQTAPEPEPAEELPEEFKRDTAVFEEMARTDPKYKDIKKTLARYAAEETKYIAKWEAENPGETFDGEAAEHNAFYQRVRPDYDQADFEAAKESLIEQRVRRKVEEQLTQQMTQREAEAERRRERAGAVQAEVQNEMFGLLGEMIRETDPQHADLAKDWASIQALDEKNPLLSDIMVEVHNQHKPLLEATFRLFRSIEPYDAKNPAHQQIATLVQESEAAILKQPVRDRYDEQGRLFATQSDYAKMDQAERAKHWYIAENELAALIRGRAIGQTKKRYEREMQRLARYTKSAAVTASSQSRKSDTTQDAPDKRDTASPTVGGRSALPVDGKPAVNGGSSGKDWFFKLHSGA